MSLFDFLRRLPLSVAPPRGNPLEGKRLRYLIGCDDDVTGKDGEIFVVGYDAEHLPLHGIGVGYCNLFDEHNTGEYRPYLRSSDTAARYREGQIDPRGPGFERNLREQLRRRKAQGFRYVELDNPDAYSIATSIRAIELARSYDLGVIAKNPGLVEGDASLILRHGNVYGVIVEQDAGEPGDMDELRTAAGRPTLPVWFVSFGDGIAREASGRSRPSSRAMRERPEDWAEHVAAAAAKYSNMSVTYSSVGEYGNSIDVHPHIP
jgi:hypothetical protein